jgi:DNA-directed RNA polymerase subunit RPC12/RpoP
MAGAKNHKLRNSWTKPSIISFYKSVHLHVTANDLDNFKYSTSIKCQCLLCGKKVTRSLKSLKSTKTEIGCQACSQISKSNRSKISEKDAIKLMRSVKLLPLKPYPGSQVGWLSQCEICSRTIKRPYSDIKSALKRWGIKIACPYCSGNRVIDEDKAIILERYGLIPIESYVNNKTSHAYKCARCGEKTKQTFINIKRKLRAGAKSYGCPTCSFKGSGERRLADLATVKKRFENAGLRLTGPYVNARTTVMCVCMKCRKEVRQSLNGVNNGKSCRFCSPKGITPHIPSYLYLIHHYSHQSLKVGVGNIGRKNDRLSVHISRGWKVIETWHFLTADDAIEIEKLFINWIRKEKNLLPSVSRRNMPQGGHSETFVDTVSINEIKVKINGFIMEKSRNSSIP